MKKIISIGAFLVSALLMCQMFPMTTGTTESWNVTTPLPEPSAWHQVAVHDNEIYVVGGHKPGGISDRVLYGSVQPNGHVEDPPGWQNTTSLPTDDTGHSERSNAPVVVYKNWIYVLDGSVQGPGWIERNTVSFTSIYPNGSVGDWTWTTPMPYRGCEEAVQWDGRIYILAGWDGFSEHNDVYFAEINQTDGTLGHWKPTAFLPRQIAHGHATTVHNGVVYFIGGHEAYPEYQSPDVYYGTINASTGEIEGWNRTTSLPVPLNNHDAVAFGDYVYVIGGNVGFGNATGLVYRAPINTDGSLGNWTEYVNLPKPLIAVGSVVLNGRLYVIGGSLRNGTLVETVYFKELLPRKQSMVFFNINPNPTTPGQTITLKGVLIEESATPVVGLPNENVQLYARPLGAPSGWIYVTSLTTNAKGIFTWQVTIPWTVAPDTYIIVIYYPGSSTYQSSYNFDLLTIQ